MADWAVSAVFKGNDGISAIFERMGKSADKFGNKTDKAFDKASKSASKFRGITKSILAASAVQKGLSLVTQGVQGVTMQFIEFDDAIVAAGARFKDIGPDAKNFDKQLIAIKKSAREAGAVTEFTAAQSAKALDFMAKAGFDSVTAMGSLRSMINLATASGEEFAQVADMSSDLLGAFGLNADNAADKIKNLNRLNDVLVKTTNSSNVTVENMFETMKQIGPVSQVLGASLEEVAALTSVLGDSGIKGSDAMTALKNAYLRLAAPAGEGAKIMKALNITLDNGQGGAKKMTVLMKELGGKLKGLGNVKQAEILDAIFGKRAIAGSKNILDNIANIDKFEQTLLKAGGTSQKVADIMRKSLGNRLKSLQSAAIELGFKFLSAFEKDGKGAIDRFTIALRNFEIKPVIDTVKTLAKMFGDLYNIVQPFLPFFPVFILFFLTYTITLKALFALNAARNFLLLANTLTKVATAQGILNALMAVNPFVIIALSVATLITLGWLLISNWDKVKEFLVSTISSIGDIFISTIDGIKNAFISIFTSIGDGIMEIWDMFGKLLENPFFATVSSLLMPLITIPRLIVKHWQPIKDFFSGIFNKVASIFEAVGSFFGFGDEETAKKSVERQAPNQVEVQAKKEFGFSGRLEIAGAPEGSKVTGENTGGGNFQSEMLGVNL